MYVCICNQVTDHEIREAVLDGVTRMRELTVRLNVASNCGRCASTAKCILKETLRERRESSVLQPI